MILYLFLAVLLGTFVYSIIGAIMDDTILEWHLRWEQSSPYKEKYADERLRNTRSED